MDSRFKRGLVVGKFCPLHKGHELVIDHALDACEKVTVISYTKPEFDRCEPAARARWLRALYPTCENLVLDDGSLADMCTRLGLPVRTLPHNDAPDDVHREFVAWLCWRVLGHAVDAVFTSEAYGEGFAAFLSNCFAAPVRHVCVDRARLAVPVSGTHIRSAPHRYRQFMSPIVSASLVRRIGLLGGESSGKTTLAQALAQALGTIWVPEYGRQKWEQRQGCLEYDDMLEIARSQLKCEENARSQANNWLVCDTSPLTTLFYCQYMFRKAEPELCELAATRYDHVFLCAPDFDFVQDGTRQNTAFRGKQHEWYVRELHERKVCYTLLSGPVSERLRQAIRILG